MTAHKGPSLVSIAPYFQVFGGREIIVSFFSYSLLPPEPSPLSLCLYPYFFSSLQFILSVSILCFVWIYPCPKLVSDLFVCDQQGHIQACCYFGVMWWAGFMCRPDGGREGEDCDSLYLLLVSAKALQHKCQLVMSVEMMHYNISLSVILLHCYPLVLLINSSCRVGGCHFLLYLFIYQVQRTLMHTDNIKADRVGYNSNEKNPKKNQLDKYKAYYINLLLQANSNENIHSTHLQSHATSRDW